jgi:hypothetical protein
VVDARRKGIVILQMLAQGVHNRVVNVLYAPTGQADQVVVWWRGHQFIGDTRMSQVGLGDDAQILEPLQNTIDRRFGQF